MAVHLTTTPGAAVRGAGQRLLALLATGFAMRRTGGWVLFNEWGCWYLADGVNIRREYL